MGACYYVEMKIYKKDATKCEKALHNYMKEIKIEHCGSTFDEMLQALLCAIREDSKYEKRDENYYSCTFSASYRWETVVHNAFYAMSPYLLDGSTVYIEPDNDFYLLIMKNGRCIDTRTASVKMLRKDSLACIKKLDDISDFCDAQWLEENEDADNCFGIFFGEELIGYCTLGYASGVIDIEMKCDDVLLSDVYIKEEWRHMGFGSKLIREVTEGLNNDCYLTYLSDELEEFYLSLEFVKVSGKDNVMVRYA